MLKPFHLSFVVPDLEAAKYFYINILGCEIGRDTGAWIDILFFGHQITIHQANEFVAAKAIDHFGPILEKSEWEKVYENCVSKDVAIETQPIIKDADSEQESGKFLVKDPAGNLLEFKYYGNFHKTISS